MTRQEAIYELSNIFAFGFYNDRVDEAVNMAIKALEQEPIRCKDCKHNYNTCFNHGMNEPICEFTDRKMKETDFCSFGERRAEE